MLYFKDQKNNIHFIEDASFSYLLPAGCIEISDAEARVIEEANKPVTDPQLLINAEARAYLESTDWYVIRFTETGVSIPDDVLAAREQARKQIK